MSCYHAAIEKKLREAKIFQCQSMSNAIRCINQRVAFKNYGISCLALIFNLSNPRTTILHAKKQIQVARNNKSCTVFSAEWYEPIAHWLRQLARSKTTWVQFQQDAETLCSPSAILHGTEPVSALTRVLLYCGLSYLFNLGFCQWQSRADRVLTLNMNIQFPLFWSTSSLARGQVSATCAGLAHGRDYSDCRASDQSHKRCLAIVFPWIVENTWKQWPTVRIFQTSSPRLSSCIWLILNEAQTHYNTTVSCNLEAPVKGGGIQQFNHVDGHQALMAARHAVTNLKVNKMN